MKAMHSPSMGQRLGAEFLVTTFLLPAIVGSGITAERPSGANFDLESLCNSTAAGAILVALIPMLGPISGVLLIHLSRWHFLSVRR